MNTDKQNDTPQTNRWLSIGVLALSVVGPIISALVERWRQRSQALQNTAQTAQTTARQRIGDLTQVGRQRAAEQIQLLQAQAQQLQEQAQQLRQALAENAEQSRKTAEQIRKAGVNLSRDLLKRGEDFTGELTKRGSKMAHELAERSEGLLEPVRERSGTFWTILGFGVGLSAALIASYLFIRRRLARQDGEQNQQIELPQNGHQAPSEQVSQPRPTVVE